jgi:hypothetical protein
VKHGDFTGLATDYAQFRPGLCAAGCDRGPELCGAGRGRYRCRRHRSRHGASGHACSRIAACILWSRWNPTTKCADKESRARASKQIVWRKGSAEATGLPDGSADLVSMASSLHWADFDKACDEFHRRRLYANVLFRTVTDEFITGVDKRSVILVVLQTPVRSHAGRRKAILRQFE